MHLKPSKHLEEQFAQAYEEYADAIFRHCYFHTFQRELAQELMQEAFLKTWEYVQDGNEIENTRAFLYRTATNLVINMVRKKKESSLDALQEAGFDPPDPDQRWQERDAIQERRVLEVLEMIEEPYRQAVILRYIEELSPAEIAEMTGESPNTVSVRIHRGLKQLRSHLDHGGA